MTHHYAGTGPDCFTAMQSALSREQFIGFLRGNVFKYAWRLGKKGVALDDARKLADYAGRLVTVLEEK